MAAAHVHPNSAERFHVITGRVGFVIGREQRILGTGERAEVPPGVVHDWWQVGDEPAEVIVYMAPGDRFADMLTTVCGLVRDGKVDRRGMPRLLQLAVTAHTYRDAMVFASPPPRLQVLAEEVTARPVAPVHLSLYGSAARGDGTTSSDLDLLAVRPDPLDAPAEEAWEDQLAASGGRLRLATGNPVNYLDITPAGLHEAVQAGEPIVDSWRHDAVHLFGQRLDTLLRAAG